MIPASQRALDINHALLTNLHLLKPNPNHSKPLIEFIKGDPVAFGNEQCRMSPQGYQIVRDSIMNVDNHSYVMANGTLSAKSGVVKHFSYGQNITPEDVIITAGVNQGLYYILLSVCDEGQNILVPELGYPFYDQLAPSFGIEVRKYSLLSEHNWEVDLKDVASKLDHKTKFLFLINPSNPTGQETFNLKIFFLSSVFTRQHIKEIIQFAQDNCLLLVVDEVYSGMAFNEWVSFGEEVQDGPIVLLSGMEKIFFVPGWQISWMIFFDKNKYIDPILKGVKNICQLLIHPNTFLMDALPKILDTLTPLFAKKAIASFKENHDFIVQEFSKIQGFRAIPAEGAFYLAVLIDLNFFSFENDVDFVLKLLEEENIMLLPLSWNGTNKYQGFRMLTLANNDVYVDFFGRLKDLVKNLKNDYFKRIQIVNNTDLFSYLNKQFMIYL